MPGRSVQSARVSAGSFNAGVNWPSEALLPCLPIFTLPFSASMIAYAPNMPPVARNSARFCETSR